jgi:hypothetical protein
VSYNTYNTYNIDNIYNTIRIRGNSLPGLVAESLPCPYNTAVSLA